MTWTRTVALITITVASIAIPSFVAADQPTCGESGGGGWCSWRGTIHRTYINDTGVVLVYFDTALDVSEARSVGLNISRGEACALSISDRPEFAKYFYATAVAATTSKSTVTIMMRGNHGARARCDRIWLWGEE